MAIDHSAQAAEPSVRLPESNKNYRWTIARKARLLAAIAAGEMSEPDACTRYRLTVEELAGWRRSIERHGIPGLRVTRLQIYRDDDGGTL